MKKTLFVGVAALAFMLLPGGSADAATYYYPNYYSTSYTVSHQAQIQALMEQVKQLQAILTKLQQEQARVRLEQPCYISGNVQYCIQDQYRHGYQNTRDEATAIYVEYRNNAAYVDIEYRDRRDESFVIAADNDNEVINYLLTLTHLSLQNILDVIEFDGDHYDSHHYSDHHHDNDVRDIDVYIDRDDNESKAIVRYDSGDTETFYYTTDSKSRIVDKLANDLDIDDSDVEDLVDWHYSNFSDTSLDDITEIRIDISGGKAYVKVEYDDGDTDRYTYNTTNKSTIISRLADDLDVDRDDLENFIEWD